MSFEIPLIPEVPSSLREEALRGNLIPFIGAGVSILAGCPGWGDLADAALKALVSQGKLRYSELDQIRGLPPRVRLSLARTLAIDNETTLDYATLLHPRPHHDHVMGRRLYSSLFSLGTIFVTTNYDLWLDDKLAVASSTTVSGTDTVSSPAVTQMHVVFRREEFNPALLSEPNTVVHLHGSVRDPETMVLTTRDYINHYYAFDRSSGDPSSENRVLTFLNFLFRHKTVLFLGYGLEELEILEYVISKGPRRESPVARHYMLQGFFSHQQTLVRNLRAYYLHECGIELIPFRRDENDWEQLLEVIEEFAQRMPGSSPLMLQRMQDMENLLR
jgi:hypothetical protein